MDGCYRIEGVPYGAEIPIFAQRDGYERFHGRILYPATNADEDDVVPQVLANIRMFPRNFNVDYRLWVNLNGRGVNDVEVRCQIRQNSNSFKTDGDFLQPLNTVSAAVSAVSMHDNGLDGVALIPGSELVLGASYRCHAFTPNLYDGKSGLLVGETDFVAGVDQPERNFALSVEGSPDEDMLYAISSNADSSADLLGNGATLRITMNREVEIVRMTEDCQSYDIQYPGDINGNNNLPPAPPIAIPNNNVSEQVRVTVSADGRLVTIAYLPPNPPLDPGDNGTSISFNGIYLKPKGDPRLEGTVIRRIGGAGTCAGASGIARDARPLKNVKTGIQTDTIQLF